MSDYFGFELAVLGKQLKNGFFHAINDLRKSHEGDFLFFFNASLVVTFTFDH